VTDPTHVFVEAWPGYEVAVRPGDEVLTGWVLREQGRWFESEIALLPKLLAPGGRVVDVGANAGVYALAAARIVGPEGRVVAFEPSPDARARLLAGAEKNGFGHLVVRPEALADRVGEALLHFDEASELASLTAPASGSGQSVAVPVSTLDALRDALDLRGVELLKIDAEGAEEAVVRGARAFLDESDPLILHEVKLGAKANLGLARALAAEGRAAYRHLPGLDLLVPQKLEGALDPFQLNLFAASSARARALAERGLLAASMADPPKVDPARGARALSRFPYARALPGSADARLGELLSLYAFAHEEVEAPPSSRFSALDRALVLSLARLNEAPSAARLCTTARLAWENGSRGLALRVLKDAIATFFATPEIPLDEPFLLPDPAYAERSLLGPVAGLVLASAMAQYEKLRAFSSFFTGLDGLAELRTFCLLGYRDDAMRRRLSMLERRANRRSGDREASSLGG